MNDPKSYEALFQTPANKEVVVVALYDQEIRLPEGDKLLIQSMPNAVEVFDRVERFPALKDESLRARFEHIKAAYLASDADTVIIEAERLIEDCPNYLSADFYLALGKGIHALFSTKDEIAEYQNILKKVQALAERQFPIDELPDCETPWGIDEYRLLASMLYYNLGDCHRLEGDLDVALTYMNHSIPSCSRRGLIKRYLYIAWLKSELGYSQEDVQQCLGFAMSVSQDEYESEKSKLALELRGMEAL